MKNSKIVWGVLLCVNILAGCKQEEDEVYYQTLGVFSKTEDSTIIEADNNERLLVKNTASLSGNLKDQDRVFLYFTIADEPLPTGINQAINIYSIEKVLFKQVLEFSSKINDSIGNDPLSVRDLWLTKDYLNLSFMYIGGYNLHAINLIEYPGEPSSDTINLEIRHNENDDAGNTYFNAFVSFDLTSLKKESADSVILCVKAIEYDNRLFEKYYTYKY
jgi:hypothetical protein